MSETPRPLWELVESWQKQANYVLEAEANKASCIAAHAALVCAEILAAALRAWDEELGNKASVCSNPSQIELINGVRKRVLGVPPKEPAQKDRDR